MAIKGNVLRVILGEHVFEVRGLGVEGGTLVHTIDGEEVTKQEWIRRRNELDVYVRGILRRDTVTFPLQRG